GRAGGTESVDVDGSTCSAEANYETGGCFRIAPAEVVMASAETVRDLLIDSAGNAVCDSCLASTCSTSLVEMREITEALYVHEGFVYRDICTGCGQLVAAIMHLPKCAHCSHSIRLGDDAVRARDDVLHTACFRILVSDEQIRLSHKLNPESRRLTRVANYASSVTDSPPARLARRPRAMVELNQRLATLRATLGFLSLEPREPELHLLHNCFDTLRGIGDIVARMARQAYDLELRRYNGQGWRPTLFQSGFQHSLTSHAGAAWARSP